MKEKIFVSEALKSLLLIGISDYRLVVKTLFMDRERGGGGEGG